MWIYARQTQVHVCGHACSTKGYVENLSLIGNRSGLLMLGYKRSYCERDFMNSDEELIVIEERRFFDFSSKFCLNKHQTRNVKLL